VAAQRGWQVVEVYEDAGISGAKGRDARPAFDRLLKDAAARKINMIAAWSVDRLGGCYQCSRRTWRLRISVQAMTSMKGAHLKPPSTERFVPRQQAPISI